MQIGKFVAVFQSLLHDTPTISEKLLSFEGFSSDRQDHVTKDDTLELYMSAEEDLRYQVCKTRN